MRVGGGTFGMSACGLGAAEFIFFVVFVAAVAIFFVIWGIAISVSMAVAVAAGGSIGLVFWHGQGSKGGSRKLKLGGWTHVPFET